MHKFGELICKHRKIILIIAILLIIPSIIGMKATRINYDILVYLPDDVETIKGENILSNDFNMGGFSVVLLENMETKEIKKLEDKIKQIDNVEKAVSIVDAVGTGIPTEMIPDEIKDKVYKDNSTIMMVTFKDKISSDSTMKAVDTIRKTVDERCKVSGMNITNSFRFLCCTYFITIKYRACNIV